MTANDLYKAGKLADAIAAQLQEVKGRPADQGQRLFLFELAAFAGDLERARRQLDVIKYDDPDQDIATVNYRRLLDSEEQRRKLFSQGIKPQFLAEPPEHVNLRLEAVTQLRQNQPGAAAQLIQQADAVSPAAKGTLNGKPFDTLRDCDDLFGPVLEVMAQGNYYWVPLEQIEAVAMKAPRFPRDLIWVPARLDTPTSSGEVFLPALYPGSYENADDQVKLGRATDWKSTEGSPVQGVGLRTFLAGDDPISLLEWRELILTS